MPRITRVRDYVALLEAALDAWNGEPEELGELLDIASARLDGWATRNERERRGAARRRILALPGGAALLLALAAH